MQAVLAPKNGLREARLLQSRGQATFALFTTSIQLRYTASLTDERTQRNHFCFQGQEVVELRRIELLTSAVRLQRSPI